MISKNELKAGDKLIAINPCIMRTTKVEALTIGKEYEIIAIERDEDKDYISKTLDEYEEYEAEYYISIINDQGDEHLYPINELEDWFDIDKFFQSMT
jgi:hypothetical protein